MLSYQLLNALPSRCITTVVECCGDRVVVAVDVSSLVDHWASNWKGAAGVGIRDGVEIERE